MWQAVLVLVLVPSSLLDLLFPSEAIVSSTRVHLTKSEHSVALKRWPPPPSRRRNGH
jgi:hypothetical protein